MLHKIKTILEHVRRRSKRGNLSIKLTFCSLLCHEEEVFEKKKISANLKIVYFVF